MIDVLVKRGHLETDMPKERMPHEHEDGHLQEAWGEAWNRFSFTALRRNQHC